MGGEGWCGVGAGESLDGSAVESDHHLEKIAVEDGNTELLLLGYDLQQHRARQVIARLVIDPLDFLARHDELPQVVERDVPAPLGVIEAAIRVLSNEAFWLHSSSLDFSSHKLRYVVSIIRQFALKDLFIINNSLCRTNDVYQGPKRTTESIL